MDSKNWYKSKGVWGGLVAMVTGLIFTAFKIDLEPEHDTIIELIMSIVTLIGGITAFIGRIVAKTTIKKPE